LGTSLSSTLAHGNWIHSGCAKPETKPRRRCRREEKANDNLPHNALEAALVPLDDLCLSDAVGGTDPALTSTTLGNTLARAGHAAVEVHSVNSNGWVVLDAQIDVFADTEAEVASLGEVASPQLVFLDLETTLQDFLSLWTPNGDVHGDLLVTTDTECSHSVAGLAVDWSLTAQLLEHFGSTSESVTRFADGDVEDEFLDAQLPHGVAAFVALLAGLSEWLAGPN